MTFPNLHDIREAKLKYLKLETDLYSFIYSIIDPDQNAYMGTLKINYISFQRDNTAIICIGFFDGEHDEESFDTRILPFSAFDSEESFKTEWNK